MNKTPTILGAGILVVILLLYACTFQVRFSEVAIVKTFGKASAADVISEPGLRLRWPWPIQSVVTYDKRVRVMEDKTEETTTADGKNIIITTYAGWTITDPFKFHTSFRTEEDGEKLLRTESRADKKAVVGQYAFSQFVSTDESERKLDEIERRMREAVASSASRYGITIETFGIKRLSVPEAVSLSIFDAMKKGQEAKSFRYLAEGQAAAQKIESDANTKRDRIVALANRKASEYANDTQKKIGEIYQQYNEYPELRIFLDQIRAVGEALKERTTLIMDTEMPPMNLFDPEKRLNGSVPTGDGQEVASDGKSREGNP